MSAPILKNLPRHSFVHQVSPKQDCLSPMRNVHVLVLLSKCDGCWQACRSYLFRMLNLLVICTWINDKCFEIDDQQIVEVS